MALQNQQVAVDDTDVSATQKNTSPSGASQTAILRGFNPDFGGELADFGATNTIVRGNQNF